MTDYQNDRLLRQAVERNLEIIGEAIGRLLRLDPDVAGRIHCHRQIIAFRNLLIHGYDVIDDERVWQIICNDLPQLAIDVGTIITTMPGTDADSSSDTISPA